MLDGGVVSMGVHDVISSDQIQTPRHHGSAKRYAASIDICALESGAKIGEPLSLCVL